MRLRVEGHALIDIKRADAAIMDLCQKLLTATQHSRDNHVVRWKIGKFLNKLYSDVQLENSPVPETGKKKIRKVPAATKPRHITPPQG